MLSGFDELVTLLDVFLPVPNAAGHHAAVDVVKRLRKCPRFCNVVDFEPDIWRYAVSVGQSSTYTFGPSFEG